MCVRQIFELKYSATSGLRLATLKATLKHEYVYVCVGACVLASNVCV